MDFARSNIRHLMGRRSINEVAQDSGVGQSWLQRFMRPDGPGGIRKGNPEKLSLLANHFGVSLSDLMLKDLSRIETADPSASHLSGTEQSIVEAAVKLVRFLEEVAPDLARPETYGTRLYYAMQVSREEGPDGILDGSRFPDASRALAARIRAAG